ncbi:MAG: HEAT repeat domain-containing protein [bacterium]|nr:HEAT repeat domain-containing protein [bacterium]
METLLNDRELAVVCAGALAKIGDRRAFEPLLSMLGDPDPMIRQAVISALNSLGHPEMPHRIKEFLGSDNPYERESAVKIAGYFGYEECKDMIIELCNDKVEEVRKAAYENLVFFEDERIPSILYSGLEKEIKKIRESIARSLAYLDSRHIIPVLEKALSDPDPWVRYYAVKTLKYHSLPNTISILTDLLNRETSNLVKIGIIDILGEIGGNGAINLIIPLLSSEDKDLARGAIAALGKIEHPNTINPLLEMLRSTKDEVTKIEIIKALGNKKGIGVIESLQWIVATENTPEIIDGALASLAKISTRESLRAIMSLTIDSTKREKCISILSKLPIEKIEYLIEDAKSMPKPVKISMILVLERMKSYDSVERIVNFLDDEDPDIRIQAVISIKNLGSIEGRKMLREHLEKEKDPRVKDIIYKLLEGK